jgi:adenosylmethionine-8-amino-7-oxononanoate aminotransferase
MPFPRQEKAAERIWDALFQKGIITYRSTALAGIDGDALMVAPPFIMEEKDITFVVDTIGQVMEETFV